MNFISGIRIRNNRTTPDTNIINLDPLFDFSASSANDENYKQLWVDGAGLIFNQLSSLLSFTDYNPVITPISTFINPEMDELKDIFAVNGSDKSTTHDYYIFYSYVFNQLNRNSALNILEIGLGTNNPMLISTMGFGGHPGASLHAWNKYLPNSNIFGADVDKDILFNTDRIKTAFVDQLKISTFSDMNSSFGNQMYDVIIDDGLHSIAANVNTLLFGLKNIKRDGWIIIEDIRDIELWKTFDFILNQTKLYKTYMIKSKTAYMFAVNRI